jgi:hypothetical protein
MSDKRSVWNTRLGSNGPQRSYRTQCKLGRHAIYAGDPAEWMTSPMGLSCQACIDKAKAVTA